MSVVQDIHHCSHQRCSSGRHQLLKEADVKVVLLYKSAKQIQEMMRKSALKNTFSQPGGLVLREMYLNFISDLNPRSGIHKHKKFELCSVP